MTRADFCKILAKHGPYPQNYNDWIIDAMQEVWDSAIDAAAKECEDMSAKSRLAYKRGGVGERANPHTDGKSDGAYECFDAIQALKGAKP